MSTKQNTIQSSSFAAKTIYPILITVSMVHLLNDTIQFIVPSLFPILKSSLSLSFAQIGLISLMINLTAAIMQPAIGIYTDNRPKPMMLPIGMLFTMLGVVILAYADRFWIVMLAVMLIGLGSAVFHPESSRVSFLAAGDKKGAASSIFQFGGFMGQAIAPILTAFWFVATGHRGLVWLSIVIAIGFAAQFYVAKWYNGQLADASDTNKGKKVTSPYTGLSKGRVWLAITILMILVFSKNLYVAAISSYYSFFAIERFGVTMEQAQIILFVFLAANVVGLLVGGWLADRFSRIALIWFSILGTAPFALLVPYSNLALSIVWIFLAGAILASSFSVIMVYANELLPGQVGLVSGIFFGLAFGLGGVGSAILGNMADATSIDFVIRCCAYLPLLGLLTIFLPKEKKVRSARPAVEV
ncbi:MFS transporter [Paenibacillus sp. GCM10027626]|uniref:MFS transporter n=1 Tax=Paenibacillus sp. GCM10027626 TaxID=3273411 RepID=UPI003636C921